MEEYGSFKSTLAKLCERGKISKEIKNTFSHYDKTQDPGMLIYSACSDLFVLFESCGARSDSFVETARAVETFISAVGAQLDGFARDIAVLCAYIRVSVEANGGAKSAFDKLKKHAEEYNRSLQNIKYMLPIF